MARYKLLIKPSAVKEIEAIEALIVYVVRVGHRKDIYRKAL